MMNRAILDGRVTMDPAAFAQFCETHSIAMCGPGPYKWSKQITVDAYGDSIMLEAAGEDIRNLRLLPDLYTAAQAGQVDGAAMIERGGSSVRLEAVVFRNSETWAGWGDCFNKPVDIGPCTTRQVEVPEDDTLELFQRVEDSATKHRVHRFGALHTCACGGYDDDGEHVCLNDGEVWTDDGVPIIDIDMFMPPRETGQLEQALVAAAGFVGPEGRRELGRLVWNTDGAGQQNMFRSWLETIEEATGERHVTWMPDLFDIGPVQAAELCGNLNYRPVCADTGSTQRGPCPAFLISGTATSDTIRVPAHVDNVSLADAAKLAAAGADPADAVAIIAAITDPDRR